LQSSNVNAVRPHDELERRPSALLVSLPWTTLTEPSLGLSLLKAVLAREHIPCRVLHLNLFVLEHLKAETYEALSVVYALNDFLFSFTLDPVVTNTQRRWLYQKIQQLLSMSDIDVRRFGGLNGLENMLLKLRCEVLPAWLGGWADEIARHEASLVGFTCMFDQTIASLALARLVRERAAGKLLALGGYALRAPTAQMVLRASPWIDAVCDGEGEAAIVGLARAAAGRATLDQVPNIVFRRPSGEITSNMPAPPVDLDTSPTPDFDDYFADIRRLSEEYSIDITPPDLPIENSRGCWWGARSHCVFCGIRDDDLAYRARTPARVLETMAELRARHGIRTFRFSDYILPNRYYETLLPELARLGQPYRLSAEVKSNISEERFVMLKESGFREVQPGIESFSSDVLRKMDKGVSAVQNVHTLLLGRRCGVRVYYNLIYGFPGDDVTAYERMVTMLPRLLHLDPPHTCLPVQITRYAPLQTRPEMFDIPSAVPDPCYEIVFSRDYLNRTGFTIDDFCYYFERPFENSVTLQHLYDRIQATVAIWRERQAKLYYEKSDGNVLTIHDSRGTEELVYDLEGAEAEFLLACTRPTSLRKLCQMQLARINPSTIDTIFNSLDQRGLVFQDEQRLISLVMEGPPVPAPGAFIATLQERSKEASLSSVARLSSDEMQDGEMVSFA
jgi:ribosomal peptide maturation radical SAM protein 1